jgi:hypothetical protein
LSRAPPGLAIRPRVCHAPHSLRRCHGQVPATAGGPGQRRRDVPDAVPSVRKTGRQNAHGNAALRPFRLRKVSSRLVTAGASTAATFRSERTRLLTHDPRRGSISKKNKRGSPRRRSARRAYFAGKIRSARVSRWKSEC